MNTSNVETVRARVGDAPRHACLNVYCGCNDGVTAGPCSEWCAANGTEVAQVHTDAPVTVDGSCRCGHETCKARTGQPQTGRDAPTATPLT
jgi:hypothetical protein